VAMAPKVNIYFGVAAAESFSYIKATNHSFSHSPDFSCYFSSFKILLPQFHLVVQSLRVVSVFSKL